MLTQTSPDASTGDSTAYTTLHLSATSFLYPPNPPDIRHCACKATSASEPIAGQDKLIRIHYAEPSVYAYNQGSFLIKETRYNTEKGWHAPTDDLVADDALFGSPIASLGWWVDGGEGESKVWESKVYYIDITGKLRERTNWSHFAPEIKEDFDDPLPDPSSLVHLTPGWKLTPLCDGADATSFEFPVITPLTTSKLAAVRSEDLRIHIFYQTSENSINEVIFDPQGGWVNDQVEIASADKVKPGTPLTAVTGGWSEVRVFYVGTTDLLMASYGDDHVPWTSIDIPPYSISPTAMLTAIAWNYASPYFEVRIYSTDDKDELYEISYSRSAGGWVPLLHSISINNPGEFSPASHSGTPLSAVAGVIVEDSWVTKVYFHPRRVIGEWDLCTKATTYNGVPKSSEQANARRQIEEETRTKIREDEERRAEEEAEQRAREEAEREAREEEAARKAQEEEEARKARMNELPNSVTLSNPIAIVGSLQGASERVDDVSYRLDLDFPITLYGYSSSTLWVTDNGMLSLDTYADARSRRNGQRLPYRDGIPSYSIFPFWADLLIAAGKPHGVFYEVTGQSPNQILVIEWYVTRFGQENQYFHFNVKFEEAKPGVVEIKYYEAVDRGTQCTVGVQGPSHYLQFSYNEAKVVPGLRLVFDTNTKSYAATQFQV